MLWRMKESFWMHVFFFNSRATVESRSKEWFRGESFQGNKKTTVHTDHWCITAWSVLSILVGFEVIYSFVEPTCKLATSFSQADPLYMSFIHDVCYWFMSILPLIRLHVRPVRTVTVVASQAVIWSDMKVNIDLRSGRSADVKLIFVDQEQQVQHINRTCMFTVCHVMSVYLFYLQVYFHITYYVIILLYYWIFAYVKNWPYGFSSILERGICPTVCQLFKKVKDDAIDDGHWHVLSDFLGWVAQEQNLMNHLLSLGSTHPPSYSHPSGLHF